MGERPNQFPEDDPYSIRNLTAVIQQSEEDDRIFPGDKPPKIVTPRDLEAE